MKICLVTAFPPSKGGLNEYGFHIARELQRDPLLSLTVVGDRVETLGFEDDEFAVIRTWGFNEYATSLRILKAVRDCKPDVVWFNLGFASYGEKPVPAFLGLLAPALTRLAGFYTHITLHQLMETVDLKDAGVRSPLLYRIGGSVATRMLLMANSISVLLPAYRRTLIEKYRGENVHFRAHGILSTRPEYPDFSLRGNPEHRILAFGKWGTYKRLEQLIEAFNGLCTRRPHLQLKLVIAGGNHPATPNYVQSVAEQHRGNERIEFTGYVPESAIPELFGTATFTVMPYTSSAGASGVAHIAAEYGVPMIASDIPDFLELRDDEGLAIELFPTQDTKALELAMEELIDNPERQRQMGEQNFSAALRMTMPQIIRKYLRSFDLHQRAKALEPIARFRRLPAWIPSRSAIFRAAAPRWAPWM